MAIRSGVNGAKTVAAVAASIFAGSEILAKRNGMQIYNESAATIYWGFSADVTVANGFPILSGDTVSFLFDPGILIPIYAIADQNRAVRVVETK